MSYACSSKWQLFGELVELGFAQTSAQEGHVRDIIAVNRWK